MGGVAGGVAADVSAVVLAAVRGLVGELHPGVPAESVRLDSRLEADLGLDSLAAAELLVRLEDACGVALPDTALAHGSTPADWVAAVVRAGGEAAPARVRAADLPVWQREPALRPARPDAAATPQEVATLAELLDWHARSHPDRVHIRLLDHGAPAPAARELTYGSLAAQAAAAAGSLTARGVRPGDRVALMLPTSEAYFAAFLGTLLAGAVPVPIYPPARPAQLEEHLRRHVRILDNAGTRALVTVPEARPLARLLRAQVPDLRAVLTPDDLTGPPADPRAAGADDLALLQYTSGSTGDPKGVMLTHAQLLANIRALGAVVQPGPDDVFVSWLPLYHDMGLIGAWLGSLYHGMPLVLMPPQDFLARPQRWLWAVHTHRATLSAAPNFGFELALRARDADLEGLDLSSWRLALNGAEPVSHRTVRRFTERFAPYGFRPEALAPVYGLAEAALCLTFPPPGRLPPVDKVDRDRFARTGRASPAAAGDEGAARFVGCGRPLPGYRVRIADSAGQALGDREQGRILFAGPSATDGYFRSPERTAELRRGEWLDTGDLGYTAGGELYVTGRVKDLIIRGGRNLHPAELEEAVGDVPGVRKGCVAAFPVADPAAGTERLVVLAETRTTDPALLTRLRGQVAAAALGVLGVPPDEVVLAPPGTVLKTSSGKIRRAAVRARYEAGTALRPAPSAHRQALRAARTAAAARSRRAGAAAGRACYGAWVWFLLSVFAAFVWPAMMLIPRPDRRWRVFRDAGRLLLRAARVPVTVEGSRHAEQAGACVVVANHASYLDGLALTLALPPRPLTFLAAGQFASRPIQGTFLRRLGAEFLPAQAPLQSTAGTRRLAELVRDGHSVVVFPEGSRGTDPGVRAFHLGAFAVAAQAGAPVLPVGLSGTRVFDPARRRLRRTRVTVRITAPLRPDGTGWRDVVRLRDAARAAVLAASDEPDAGA